MAQTPKKCRNIKKAYLMQAKLSYNFFSPLFGKVMTNGHYWTMCTPECGPMIMCGFCGNNCCSGGTRSVSPNRRKLCGCDEAYSIQTTGYKALQAFSSRRKIWRKTKRNQ